MKRIWQRFPTVLRWILVTMLVMFISAGSVYAYVALTATGTVEVKEPLSFVGDPTFVVELYPQQSQTEQVTIANASPFSLIVDLLSEVIPDLGNKGLSIDVPSNITVPATGQVTVDIDIVAGKNAEPGLYSVTIKVDR